MSKRNVGTRSFSVIVDSVSRGERRNRVKLCKRAFGIKTSEGKNREHLNTWLTR